MANWSNPTITTQYDVFVNESKDRDVDAITLCLNVPVGGVPVGAIQMVRLTPTIYALHEFNGSGFAIKYLSVSGGGTGAADAGNARVNLGIGTMGVQNSNAVSISGGTISNLTAFTINCPIIFNAHAACDIGTNAAKARRVYIHEALVLPFGVDRYATS